MKKYMGYIFGIIIVAVVLLYLAIGREQLYSTTFYYMDTYIEVDVYTTSAKEANEAFKVVEKLYKDYHELTNRYDKKSQISMIRDNKKDDMYLDIDKRLYDLIAYGKDAYLETNGNININIGNAVDLWKGYRESKTGIPTEEELNTVGSTDINDIVLKNDKILNNHPNIDLGSLTKGYVTELAGEYLESINIKKYLINAGGTVKVGRAFRKDYYNIGIQSPEKKGGVATVIKGKNMSVSTSGSYERYYEYDGKLYHHIIDPKTLTTPNYMLGVTVITDDAAKADMLSTALFLLPPEEGKEFLKKYKNTYAIWYVDSDTIIKSEGFDKYESK